MKYTHHELYGGGISVNLPIGLIDASTLRQIPDTQEVFLTDTDNTTNPEELEKNDTIIFDLMEKESEVQGLSAAEFHMNEIAKLNGADESNGQSVKLLDSQEIKLLNDADASKAYVAVGFEYAKKWGRDLTPLIIVLGLIRIEKVDTDVLITFNIPVETEQEFDQLKTLVSFESPDAVPTSHIHQKIKIRENVVSDIVKSLKVEDWGLFC